MRILVVQPWISYRGAQTVSLNQVFELQKITKEARIVCLYVDWDRIDKRFKKLNFVLPAKFLQNLFQKSRLLVATLGLPILFFLVLANYKKFDILNPHNLPSSWICASVSRLTGVKVVWTVHGVPKKALKESTFFEKLIWFLATSPIDNLAVKGIDKIIAVSEKVAQDVKVKYGRDSTVLYPPIVLSNFKREDLVVREKFGISNKHLLLLHVSYLHPAKNVAISINTLKMLLLQIPNSQLLIIGSGPERFGLESSVRKFNLDRKVHFAGFVKPENLVNFYQACDLVLAPFCETEGFPLIVFEAALVGKVAIVAEGSGIDEIVSKNNIGIVARPTPKDFAKATINFYKNQKFWLERGLWAKKFVKENLSGQIYAKNFLDLI